MTRWIILLRGVNVGGTNKLPMAELRAALTAAGFADVKTYIQSGNVVLNAEEALSADDVSKSVQNVLAQTFNIQTPLLILSEAQLKLAAQKNPLGQEFDAPNWMFLFFLSETPKAPNLETLKEITTANERWELLGDIFYVFAGDGAGRSKLIARAEKLLGVRATARNWRTVRKLLEMIDDQT